MQSFKFYDKNLAKPKGQPGYQNPVIRPGGPEKGD